MPTIRCCLCRADHRRETMERSKLPGTGYRCVDRDACRARVIDIISANVNLAGACNEGSE